jgi:DNA-binding NarL/FixJ family response regulator
MAINKTTKVFIIDDQPLFRQGIRTSLSNLPDIEVCGEAEVDEQVLPTIEASPPDVVLLDIIAPSLDGLKLCRVIKQHLPGVSVIILTAQPDDEQLFQAIKAHASAYLTRAVTIKELAQTIRRCGQGEHPINESLVGRPKLAEQVLQQFYELSREKEAATFISPLTPRETEILSYMAQGYLNKQIADVLNVSEQTIKNHITSILRKLNANARTQAVIVAIKKGLITISKET